MRLKKRHGFTLVELLLAVLILAGAVGGVLLLYTTSMVSSQLAWDTTVAVSHAEHILEEMQSRNTFEDIVSTDWKNWAASQRLNTLPGENVDIVFADKTADPLDIQVGVKWVRKSRQNNVVLRTSITK